jgi:protein TonB
MKNVILFLFLVSSLGCYSQSTKNDSTYEKVDSMPEFIGGQAKMYKFLDENIKYPTLSTDIQVQGKIYVKFVIKKDGSIDDIQVIKGSQEKLNDEVIRVIKLMSKWLPGMQNDQVVDCYFTLPIQIHWN